jgi:large subunit ribosomal protein L33
MASIQDHLIRLKCVTCGQVNYFTRKNRKKVERKIDLSKYCSHDRKHTQHKEAKKG